MIYYSCVISIIRLLNLVNIEQYLKIFICCPILKKLIGYC